MEASGAGLAGNGQGQGGDAGQQAAQGAAEGQQQAPGGLDPASIQQALESMQGGQEQLRQQLGQMGEFLQTNPWQPPAEEPGPEPLDLGFLNDPMLEPQQLSERLTEVINQQAQQQAQSLLEQRLAPLEQRVNEREMHSEAADLVAEFPELGDPKVANEVVSNARAYADLLGMPEAANKPAFWRVIYMAGRAAEHASQEGSGATPGAAHLEGGAGAAPGQPQVDLGDMIVNGGGPGAPLGSRVLPFG